MSNPLLKCCMILFVCLEHRKLCIHDRWPRSLQLGTFSPDGSSTYPKPARHCHAPHGSNSNKISWCMNDRSHFAWADQLGELGGGTEGNSAVPNNYSQCPQLASMDSTPVSTRMLILRWAHTHTLAISLNPSRKQPCNCSALHLSISLFISSVKHRTRCISSFPV